MRGSSGMRPRARRLALLGGGLAFVLLVVASLSQGATNDRSDPRNKSFGLKFQGSTSQDCWAHHRTEGMRDSHVVVAIFPKAVKVGEPAPATVQIENPWKHGISDYEITLNIPTDAEGNVNLVPLLPAAPTSVADEQKHFEGDLYNKQTVQALWEGEVGGVQRPEGVPRPGDQLGPRPPVNATHAFTVNASTPVQSIVFHLGVVYSEEAPADAGVPPNLYARIQTPQTQVQLEDATARDWDISFPHDGVTPAPGNWSVFLQYNSGRTYTARYTVAVTIVHKEESGVKAYTVVDQPRNPPSERTAPQIVIPKNSPSTPVTFELRGLRPGRQVIEVKATALLWWDHQAPSTPNEDTFIRYRNVTVEVGDVYVPSDEGLATGGQDLINFYQQTGEITGFAAAFLLVPSLLFGGTYGRTSRKTFNALLGGAKRRVMFHNLLSLGLIAVALVHILLFLLEVRYTLLMGVFWGGLSALSLLMLGLTGYYQVPLIQRLGYGAWRYVHLAFGVLVVLLVSYHAIADGPDFFFLKDQLPEGVRTLNLAQK